MLYRWSQICLFLLLVACSSGSGQPVYQVGRDPTWWPLDLYGRESAVRGFSDELLRAIAEKEKIQIVLYSAGGESLMLGLNREWANGVLSSLDPIPQTESVYDFSTPYLLVGPVLVVAEDSPVAGLSDLSNSLVAVVNATPLIPELAQIPYLLMRPFPNVATALEAVNGGAVAGAIVESLQAYTYLADLYKDKLKVVTAPLDNMGLRLIVLKGKSRDLMHAFEKGLHKSIENGTYATLAEKWQLNLDVNPNL